MEYFQECLVFRLVKRAVDGDRCDVLIYDNYRQDVIRRRRHRVKYVCDPFYLANHAGRVFLLDHTPIHSPV